MTTLRMLCYSIERRAYSNGSAVTTLVPVPRDIEQPWDPYETTITGNLVITATGTDAHTLFELGKRYVIEFTPDQVPE